MTTRPIRNGIEGMCLILRFARKKGFKDVSWLVEQANIQVEILNCCDDNIVAIGEGYQWSSIPLETLKPVLEIERINEIDLYHFVNQKLYPLYLKKEASLNYE
ncbi:hypothetical protein CMI37_20680 [Candidatus Pacearchaeota archaeon]|nr:hypothetical protein [Candidatus Pacearchaeota archaeon]